MSVAFATLGNRVGDSDIVPPDVKAEIETILEDGFDTAAATDLEELLVDQTPEVQEEAIRIYSDGALRGFQVAILVGGIVALAGAAMAIRLPRRKLESDQTGGSVAETARNSTLPGVQLEMTDVGPHR